MKLLYPYQIIENINKYEQKEFDNFIMDYYNMSFLIYYYKRLSKKNQALIFDKIKKKYDDYNEKYYYNMPFWLKRYSKNEKKLITSNLWFFQISFWCTKWCNFCWCDAPYFNKPISMPFNHIKFSLKKYSKNFDKNYTYLYRASDPLDYTYWKYNYKDILKIYKKVFVKLPYTSTAVNDKNHDFYNEIKKSVSRVSYLWSNKNIYEKIKYSINDDSYDWYSIKDTWRNWLNWYNQQKYDNGILCLNWVLLTPFFAYNLVNIWRCNNFFPQWLLSYPIVKINNIIVKKWDNLVDHLNSKVVMYDFVDRRSNRGKYDKVVVFLQDFKKIYMTVCSKQKMNSWYIEILSVVEITYKQYYNLCFTLEWYSILFNIESWWIEKQ